MKRGDPQVLDYYKDQLKKLKELYETRKEAYRRADAVSTSGAFGAPEVSGVLATSATDSANMYTVSPEDEHIRATNAAPLIADLHNGMPAEMCSFWEFFGKECKAHFEFEVEDFYDDEVMEIFLIRNCILHNRGIVDDSYVSQTKLKKFEKDEPISLRATDVDEFFGYLEHGCEDVKQKILGSLENSR